MVCPDGVQAVQATNKIGEAMSAEAVREHFVPLVRRLATGEWFTSRASASGLFALAYPHASDEQKSELRESFRSLVTDSTPIVRRNAGISLGVCCLQSHTGLRHKMDDV